MFSCDDKKLNKIPMFETMYKTNNTTVLPIHLRFLQQLFIKIESNLLIYNLQLQSIPMIE